MIISHKYRFIFIKTAKTAGTSLEIFLSQAGGETDVVTPIFPLVEPHRARNHDGFWNPIPELLDRSASTKTMLRELLARRRFYNHMPARLVKARTPRAVWHDYLKFCIERNPWDKTLSHFHMLRDRAADQLTFERYIAEGKFPTNLDKYTDDEGNLMVDEVIRYEELNEGLGRIFSKLGLPFDGQLGPSAKGEHRRDRRPYQEIYTPAQRETVARVFAREIALFGYTFQEQAP